MAAIKHTLKRDVFLPAYERLIAMVHVTKSGKKKKSSFLCVIVTIEKPMKVIVYQLKKFGESYKKKESWLLRHLKLVDGKDAAKETAEFELHFDKVYKWIASSIQEKNSFISSLWKLSLRYIPRQKPQFINIPEDLMEDVEATLKTGETAREVVEDSIIEVEDYQEITPREEADLEKLMSQCDYAISNAEAFMDQLSRELSVLDGANIHTIMASEQQVVNLMNLLEDAIVEASKIEDKLDVYDKLLQNVRDHMESMEEKDTMIQVQNKNTTRLLEDLDNLTDKLDLPHNCQMALLGGDLTIASNVLECTVAAQALQEAMNAKLQPGLVKLAAVSEQQKLFEKLRTKFAQQLSRHLNNLFIHLGNEIGESLGHNTMELSLPKHHSCHRELSPYIDLMLWLKTADNNSFKQLAKIYTASLSKLYERELKEFFESAKPRTGMVKGQEKKGKGNNNGGSSSTGSQELQSKGLSGRLRSQSLIGMDRTDYGSDLDITERHKFDKILENILCELEPLCLAEQNFCVMFFHARSETINSQESENNVTSDKSNEDVSVASDGPPKKQSGKQINEEIRKMMGELFAVLEPELQNFISEADKVDTFYNMYMLVRLSQHVMLAQDAGGSFLSIIFANGLVQAKRNFDKFMKSQINSIEEAKVSKKSRVGIIPFVANFEDFAQQAEIIFRGSDRRTDLDKWYVKLMTTMIEAIPRVASEQQKNPVEVVMLENYHNLYSSLSQLKITCLENERREARQRYTEHLQAYVTAYLGRPLEKLNNFFEGIQSKVAQGVKEEEVGYQLAFSKQELRKVIKEYPGKEVKKGLESLYKKIDKHLCEEENLLQVVWHSMQEEFIRQYKNFESLIERCYPGSMITLEFTINDILAYFSDIARSH